MIEQHEVIPVTPPATRTAALRVLLTASGLYLLYALLMAGFNHWSPALPPQLWAVCGCASTLIYLILLVSIIRMLTQPTLTARQETLLAVTTLVAYLAANPAVWQVVKLVRHSNSFWEAVNALVIVSEQSPDSPFLWLFFLNVFPFLLILSGVFFGRLVSHIIKERALLVPVGIISGLIDFWGVYWGPVNMMSEKAPTAVSAIGSAATVAARVPEATVQHLHLISPSLAFIAQIAPPDSIGIGDFVFLSLFLACAYRLGFSAKRTMWGIFFGLLLSSLIFAMKGMTLFHHKIDFGYLPGLIFISGGMLLANLRAWKLSRQEWAMTGVVTLLILALIGNSIANSVVAQPAQASTSYAVTAASAPDALAACLTGIGRRPHTPPTLRLYKAAFYYEITPTGPKPAGWEARVLGLPKKATLKGCWEYHLQAQPLDQPNTWGVMEEADAPPEGILRQLKLPAKADKLAALLQLPQVPSTAYTLLAHAKDYQSLLHGQHGFIIQLTPTGGNLLAVPASSHGQNQRVVPIVIKALPYDK